MSVRWYENPAEFGAAIQRFGAVEVQLIAKQVACQVFTEVSEQVLMNTPVLTGKARGNWQPTVGEPSGAQLTRLAGVQQTGEEPTGSEKESIKGVCDQFMSDSGATMLYLSNNLPYIALLDQGSSAKAPAGIVHPAISASLDALKDRHGVKV